MTFGVHHGWEHETPEAKARWFQSLSLEERMELLCEFTNLVLSVNPAVAEKKHARSPQKGVRVLRLS